MPLDQPRPNSILPPCSANRQRSWCFTIPVAVAMRMDLLTTPPASRMASMCSIIWLSSSPPSSSLLTSVFGAPHYDNGLHQSLMPKHAVNCVAFEESWRANQRTAKHAARGSRILEKKNSLEEAFDYSFSHRLITPAWLAHWSNTLQTCCRLCSQNKGICRFSFFTL